MPRRSPRSAAWTGRPFTASRTKSSLSRKRTLRESVHVPLLRFPFWQYDARTDRRSGDQVRICGLDCLIYRPPCLDLLATNAAPLKRGPLSRIPVSHFLETWNDRREAISRFPRFQISRNTGKRAIRQGSDESAINIAIATLIAGDQQLGIKGGCSRRFAPESFPRTSRPAQSPLPSTPRSPGQPPRSFPHLRMGRAGRQPRAASSGTTKLPNDRPD